MPAIQTFYEEFGSDATIVGIAFKASEAEVQTLVDQQGLTFPNIYDPSGAIPAAYSAGVPHYVFLDKAGRIADYFPGAPPDATVIKERIEQLLSE